MVLVIALGDGMPRREPILMSSTRKGGFNGRSKSDAARQTDASSRRNVRILDRDVLKIAEAELPGSDTARRTAIDDKAGEIHDRKLARRAQT